MFCGVCVQCISGLLLGRHQDNRFPNCPLPFPSLLPRGSNCPLVHLSNRSPEAGPAPSPPREAPPDLASNSKSTVTCVLSAFQVCSSLLVCFLLSVGGGGVKMFLQNKVAVGRELSMDRVAKPTNYKPPRVRTYP